MKLEEITRARTLVAARQEMEHVPPPCADHAAPRISYRQALAARFRWHGKTYTVGDCDTPVLRCWLLAQTAKTKKLQSRHLREIVDALDVGDTFGRWQAIDSALLYKVALDLLPPARKENGRSGQKS